eukprot:13463941-Ditylum_brightwellii.AAC.1
MGFCSIDLHPFYIVPSVSSFNLSHTPLSQNAHQRNPPSTTSFDFFGPHETKTSFRLTKPYDMDKAQLRDKYKDCIVSAITSQYRIDPDPDPHDSPHTPAPDKINIYLDDDGIFPLGSMEEMLAHPVNARDFLKSSSIQMKKDLSIMKWYCDLTTHDL